MNQEPASIKSNNAMPSKFENRHIIVGTIMNLILLKKSDEHFLGNITILILNCITTTRNFVSLGLNVDGTDDDHT